MPGLTFIREPALRSPALIAAFAGWGDGGEAASAAVRWLVRRLPGTRFAHIEGESYHDFTSSRPSVRQVRGERRLTWPVHDFFSFDGGAGRDLVLLIGREPELRWRAYCDTILELAERVNATTLISLGAYIGDTSHVAAVPVSGFATTDEFRDRLGAVGIEPSTYGGSGGITTALHEACQREGLPSASLWAAVPHYLPTIANPKAALGLVRKLDALLDLQLELGQLEKAAAFFQRQVDEAVSRNRRATGQMRDIERRAARPGDELTEAGDELPDAADVIRDLEAFLGSGSDDAGEE